MCVCVYMNADGYCMGGWVGVGDGVLEPEKVVVSRL